MTPERWRKIENIFEASLDRTDEERESFIEKECGADADLCAEVKKLLRGYETGDAFLESPVWTDSYFLQTTLKNQLASSLSDDSDDSEDLDPMLDQFVGEYRLIRQIGRGGMGIVYLAERREYRRQVAVKVVKRGMDTDFILRRFRQERQVLASLAHPQIARLLDGGTTPDGRPYLIMEYIEGTPIDKFCDQNKLTIEARLKLFQTVCAAVAYSHQRLVIHRDIKPSNVLVTVEGEAKLLDFGIAKLLDASLLSESYEPTATYARMMTPDYASPEQLRGELVTTASDVYSLGVLLYFLLTGHLPFSFSGPVEAFAKLVSERKPERPSRIITHGEKATLKNSDGKTNRQSLAQVAENRRTEPERLRRYLADDLDNIVLKALHKDTSRRYSSVEQLSEDVRRHLEGLPVKARGDDFVYKFRKFVGRHKTSVAIIGLLNITLLGGITATTWQTHIAGQERNRAEAESRRANNRFNESRRLTESLMFELHDAIRDLQGGTAARELLARKTLEHLDGLALEAEGDAELQSELAIAYINLGNIQGNPYYPNLGDTNGALESYRKAEKLTEKLLPTNPADQKLRRRFWLTQIRIADVIAVQGDLATAKQFYARAGSLIEPLAAENSADESLRRDLATGCDRQGNIAMRMKDFRTALLHFNKALEIFENASGLRPEDDELLRAVAATHGKIGTAYLKAGAAENALTSYEKLLRINQSRLGRKPGNAMMLDDTAGSWRELGDAQAALKDYNAAFASYGRQLEMYSRLAAADSANVRASVETAVSYQRLGILQFKTGKLLNALKNHEKAHSILRDLEAKNSQNTYVLNQLPAAFYYLAATNYALALVSSPISRKGDFLKKACVQFKQSFQAYSKLSSTSVNLPEGVEQLGDIEKRIYACDAALAE
jgi:eukaryotic-like serine/threonine-protein kinase